MFNAERIRTAMQMKDAERIRAERRASDQEEARLNLMGARRIQLNGQEYTVLPNPSFAEPYLIVFDGQRMRGVRSKENAHLIEVRSKANLIVARFDEEAWEQVFTPDDVLIQRQQREYLTIYHGTPEEVERLATVLVSFAPELQVQTDEMLPGRAARLFGLIYRHERDTWGAYARGVLAGWEMAQATGADRGDLTP